MADSPGEIDEDYGQRFGRPDIDRLGLFDDSRPIQFGVYTGKPFKLRDILCKGKQMTSGTKGDLFQKEIRRMFVGEVLVGLGPKPKRGKKKEKPQPLGIIRPPGGNKKHSTPGDFYGCFAKQPKAFSPELKVLPKTGLEEERTRPNFQTSPNPFGGPGYLKITLSPYLPIYGGFEPYDRKIINEQRTGNAPPRRFVNTCLPKPFFDDNPYRHVQTAARKHKGAPTKQPKNKRPIFALVFPRAPYGPNSGCFNPFPKYVPEKIRERKTLEMPSITFNPGGGPDIRTRYTISIVERVTNVACNQQNYTDYREQVYPFN